MPIKNSWGTQIAQSVPSWPGGVAAPVIVKKVRSIRSGADGVVVQVSKTDLHA